VNNIHGEKVLLRDWSLFDYADEAIWDTDQEVHDLDPTVGESSNSHQLSIFTLNGVHIGMCALYNRTPDEVQFGIRIGDRNYWNMGYGTEATMLLTEYAFEVMGVSRVWLKVLPWNVRAIRCYEKCGYMRAGMIELDGYKFTVMEKRRQE